ncbi:alpha/beta fold hydrolase [soil metagenome]
MKLGKKIIIGLVVLLLVGYAGICYWFYSSQDKALFNKVPHAATYQYQFAISFEERDIAMQDGKKLNGVLFKADSSKGLILWLPGGRGMLDSLADDAACFTKLHYDVFMINFRGFGKSEGSIKSEQQFNSDMQSVYDYFKKQYNESHLVIFGYSIGTGPAAALAANNHPKMLILQAPYYSMQEMTQKAIPYLPMSLLLKYHFNTYENLPKVTSPVVLIHGRDDKQINISVSYRLQKLLKPTDELIALEGQPHNNFIKNEQYLKAIERVLK